MVHGWKEFETYTALCTASNGENDTGLSREDTEDKIGDVKQINY